MIESDLFKVLSEEKRNIAVALKGKKNPKLLKSKTLQNLTHLKKEISNNVRPWSHKNNCIK